MIILDGPIAEGSSYAPAIFGLAGSLIGGFTAGTVSLFVARQAREAAEGAWIRDNRRDIYDRYLTYAERLLHSCEAYKAAHLDKEETKANVEFAFTNFWEVYGVVQTVAGIRLVEAARIHAYRLGELAASLSSTSVIEPENFTVVVGLIRDARHDMINAMRAELGLEGGVRPASEINPFAGTDLEERYAEAKRNRPGPLTLWEGEPPEPARWPAWRLNVRVRRLAESQGQEACS
jgi:hypothetical protein